MNRTQWTVGAEKKMPVIHKRAAGYKVTGWRVATVVSVERHFVVMDMGGYGESFTWTDLENFALKHMWIY